MIESNSVQSRIKSNFGNNKKLNNSKIFAWENIEESFNKTHSKSAVSSYCSRCCGAAVITSASHAEGLPFDPGQQKLFDL